jgi:enduracididine biosynthesis enzyme MppP
VSTWSYTPPTAFSGAVAGGNLTQLETLALNSRLNVADGHARQEPTAGQMKVIQDLPELFVEASGKPVEELERAAFGAYLRLLGQHSFPTRPGRVLSCYSSSVAMEIVARSLATATDSMALIHPTFDNIPDILKGVGLRLVPLSEADLHHGDLTRIPLTGGVFVTTPNNPTGRVLSEPRLRELALSCASRDEVLVLDTSFRGFDTRAQYDHYAVLEDSGCRWIVIEDTGKLWPTLDLKVGWLVLSEGLGLPVPEVHSDILLGVSPLVLAMLRGFAEDAERGGLAELHRFVAANRELVRSALADVPGVSYPDTGSRGSVERIGLGDRSGMDTWAALQTRNVYALPCGPFFWNDPAEGDHMLRIALARPTPVLTAAVEVIRSVLLGR